MKLNEEKIVELYESGLSPYQIAEKYGTYTQKIRRLLKKLEVPLRNKSEAQKKAIETGRSKHPTAGRERTEEEKMAISSKLVESWSNLPESEREARREQSKEIWNKKGKKEIEEMRSKAAAQIRIASREGSKLEKEVQKILSDHKYRFEAHKKDVIPTQKLEIDLFLPEIRTIIEVDGLSHFEPIWGHKQLAKQQKFDAQKEGLMLGRGFNIVRIQHLGNSLAIAKLENLKNELISILDNIKTTQAQGTLEIIKYE